MRAPLEWEPGTIGSHGTQTVELSPTPPAGSAALAGVPDALYGAATLGDVRPLLVAVDPAQGAPRLWVDTDMDGDLADERETRWSRSGAALTASVSVLVPVSTDTVEEPVDVRVMRSASIVGAPLTIFPRAYRTGEAVIAGRLRRIALVDENSDLRFDDARRDVFYVDVDGDGAFAAGHGTHEHFHFGRPVNIGGQGFDVAVADAAGSALLLRPVAETPPPLPKHRRVTRYVQPGRKQAPPAEDLATLLARFGDETGKTYSERAMTVAAIGRTGADRAAVFLLGVAAKDGDASVRAAAIRALGNPAFASKTAGRLVKLARGGDASQASAAIQALYNMGYSGREALFVDLLRSSQTAVVAAAARQLAYEATDKGRAAVLRACTEAATPALRFQAYLGARALPHAPPPATTRTPTSCCSTRRSTPGMTNWCG